MTTFEYSWLRRKPSSVFSRFLLSSMKKVFDDPAYKVAVEKARAPWEFIRYGSAEDCAEYVKKNGGDLEHNVHVLPQEVDQEVARIKLEAMGVAIDTLTEQQFEYLNQWEEGT